MLTSPCNSITFDSGSSLCCLSVSLLISLRLFSSLSCLSDSSIMCCLVTSCCLNFFGSIEKSVVVVLPHDQVSCGSGQGSPR